jgi:hypothetical protein
VEYCFSHSVLFTKFVFMNELIKHAFLLILVVSLNLVWINSSFDDNVDFGIHATVPAESSDASGTSEYLHSFYCEDDIFITNSKVKTDPIYLRNDLVPVYKVSTLNEYQNNVWQPPKFS